MLFLKATTWGGSMNHLDTVTTKESNEPKFGLIRRAFSSKKRKKPNHILKPTNYLRLPLPLSAKSLENYVSNEEECQDMGFLSLYPRESFSRKNYGSVEMLINRHMEGYTNNAGRFRVELGSSSSQSDLRGDPFVPSKWSNVQKENPLHLENPEQETRWYFKYFLGKLHQVYMGIISDRDPLVISTVITDVNNNNINQYRAIFWRKTGSQKLCIPYNAGCPMTLKKILSSFDQQKFERFPKEVFNYEVQKDVLILEEQEGSVNFKFGVVFCEKGQTSDEEMYNNVSGSEDFENFLNILGEKIPLLNWDRFRGGLDVKSNTTGKYSHYTIYEGHEIMFHVSTVLPMSSDNRQQIERKRHIGNDIVNIIFIDDIGDEPFEKFWTPSMMKTHFTHIFALVSYIHSRKAYRLSVYSEESVPLFGPPLPSPAEFVNNFEFREFLIVKLINGEKSAFNTPVFSEKRERTMEMLLNNILESYTSENTNMLNRRAFSDIVLDQSNGISTTKEMTRNDAFIKFGQMLKVNIIIKGDAPTSNITTRVLKRVPWQPRIFANDLQFQIQCGDSWGDKLILGTDKGTFMVEENAASSMLIEKACETKQIEIVESLGFMIIRCDKGRDSKIAIIQLSEFKNIDILPMTKADVKKLSLDKTRGCHLFSISKPHIQPMRLVVAVNRRLQIFIWKCVTCCSSLSNWNQFSNSSIDASFQYVRELPTFEVPHVLTILESQRHVQISIGYKNQFDIIDEKTGDTIHLFKTDTVKSTMIAALDLCSEEEPELLLCFNRTCHFQKIKTNGHIFDQINNSEFDFTWNFEPKNIVLVLPYILAFTQNAVEIRLVVNGSLVHTMSVPNCKLITSKIDLFFSTTADNLCKEFIEKQKSGTASFDRLYRMASPPASLEYSDLSQSPTMKNPTMFQRQHIYKISLNSMSGCGYQTPLAPKLRPSLLNFMKPEKESDLGNGLFTQTYNATH